MDDIFGVVGGFSIVLTIGIVCFTLLITIGSFAFAFFIIRRVTGGSKAERQLRQSGVPAQATIVRIWETGVRVNMNPQVGLLLEVHPAGGAPFQAEAKTVISQIMIPQFQPGAQVPVKYDPNDTSKVVLAFN